MESQGSTASSLGPAERPEVVQTPHDCFSLSGDLGHDLGGSLSTLRCTKEAIFIKITVCINQFWPHNKPAQAQWLKKTTIYYHASWLF